MCVLYKNSFDNIFSLSPRQCAILFLASEGVSDTEIAEDLQITINTIKYHWNIIRGKMSAKNKTHAVAIAIRSGVIS